MSVTNFNGVLDAIKTSLAAALPGRFVHRKLVEPASVQLDEMRAGTLCLVARSGGGFANYRGREGELGSMAVSLVGYLYVDEGANGSEAIERAEMALLAELLQWVGNAPVPGLDDMEPGDWRNSAQLEYPYGWLVLELKVKT